MSKCLLGLLFFWISLFATASQKDNISVIAVEYPPYTSANMPNFGVTFKLLNDYAKRHFQRSISPTFLPPARAQALMQTGDWCLSFIPPIKNANAILLSDAEITLSFFRFKTEDEFKWQSLSELKGKTVAMLRTLDSGPVAKNIVEAGIKIVPIDSLSQGVHMLLNKRVDYWFSTQNALDALSLDDLAKDKLQFAEIPLMVVQPRVFYSERCKKELNL